MIDVSSIRLEVREHVRSNVQYSPFAFTKLLSAFSFLLNASFTYITLAALESLPCMHPYSYSYSVFRILFLITIIHIKEHSPFIT